MLIEQNLIPSGVCRKPSIYRKRKVAGSVRVLSGKDIFARKILNATP